MDFTPMSAGDDTTVAASTPYSYAVPSPPFIHIPAVHRRKGDKHHPLDLMPSYEHVDSSKLTSQDLVIITRNQTQIATDRAADWSYEQRREAQRILDFLYLGPTSVVRDLCFLRREQITLMLVLRDSRLANRSLLSVDRAASALGIPVQYLDFEASNNLIRTFPEAVRLINDHLLAVYHGQAQGRNEAGQMFVEAANFRRGKVLVTCETGNAVSAAVVAAYIMALFGRGMVTTLQFINIQRFCCGFDADTKRMLLTWEDIVRAQSAVSMHARVQPSPGRTEAKRNLDAMLDTTTDEAMITDEERFTGRGDFAPFVDVN